jgi:hypothetical protein
MSSSYYTGELSPALSYKEREEMQKYYLIFSLVFSSPLLFLREGVGG